MNEKPNVSVRLGILSLLFLAAAIALLIFRHDADIRSGESLEAMRESAAERKTQDPEPETRAESASVTSESETVAPEPSETVPTFTTDTAEHQAGSGDGSPEISSSETTDVLPVVSGDLADNPYLDSFLANDDMGAWLKIDGTVIDYPVMWTPRDENYYLERNFSGNPDKNGCLILDTDSCLNPLTTNLIIHGHNMKSGAMFGTLQKYSDAGYCREHSLITLYAEDCERRYEVIAVFRSQVYRKTDQVFKFYKFFQANTPEEFDDFYQNIKALSLYDTGVTAAFGDRFITLSTCAYHVENGRFVVVAKEIESGAHYQSFR
ncbi:MAG: class B sortase [Lachnospiraceae bacterium]|nr:class B sortase [Lachnospiraceae bacterium]